MSNRHFVFFALLTAAVSLVAAPMRAAAQITCPTGVTQSGSSANDTFNGTSGGDRITGQGGNDDLSGFDGSDCLNGGSYNDILEGGNGNDDLRGEGGDDILDGGAGDDKLNGGRNNDRLIPRTGVDNVAGEGGDDIIVVAAGGVPAGKVEKINGGQGTDTLQLICIAAPGTTGDFTVTDPNTGGTYKVKSVENVTSSCPVFTSPVTANLTTCDPRVFDSFEFDVAAGETVQVAADTVDAGTAADLCIFGSCDNGASFSSDDPVPCTFPPPLFQCPSTSFVPSSGATCSVTVTTCSANCADPGVANYRLSVTRNGGNASLLLTGDDVP